jgi:hypothetical protein
VDQSKKRFGPKKLGDLLPGVLTEYGLPSVTAREELELAWTAAAGDVVGARTKVGALRRGVLEIFVSDPILLQELEGFEKQRLLADMKERLYHNRVDGLKFRRQTSG